MSQLWDRYQTLKASQPRLRARDAAAALQVSECELTAADPAATPLRAEWPEILAALAPLGRVMALTRNHACVHETKGDYANVEIDGKVGLAINPVIDLRIFLFHWRHGFALRSETPRGVQRSLQFFDRHGEAMHKVYLTEASDIAAYDDLVARFAAPAAALELEPVAAAGAEQPDEAIDRDAFQNEWQSLSDVHAFHPFLRRWQVSRRQGFRLAPPGQAWRVREDAVEQLLRRAAATATPIMVFAGNRGMIQIHTGTIVNVQVVGDWLNVLDPDFNLHLRTDLIAEAWITRKPGDNGVVTSLELFDEQGESLATFFGERKPGRAERAEWVKLLGELPPLEQEDVA
ncbi:hemin-degrading factor [Chromobacterium subtsugae]|uniref:Hemin-degrading factor n=1 Tax=Chromobacterium subtsugae TaxID=251747 RepID=A0ABS7FHQ1_9NEIS|nr:MULTISPECIES: hemin-degrading factor [Chromobacterium]KUM05382.1 hemin degrading factor [Chromobacterium subtsugae]KZE85245.1 hemin degrading factor [Chromobacterium sp. F49]MBW7568429.1 hemin-degrading factor [Chromobacterium subtsugae]MBW8289604.1 hemin-degrading factor [Chromobacterium subtsugae]WSE92580.1 hemin-degrading factor [Chromobacterium subtsugae]